MKIFLICLVYLIPGTICSIGYLNFFYRIYKVPDLPRTLENIIGLIYLIPYFLFYLMGLTFIILLFPIAMIILYGINLKKKFISYKYLVIMFIWSLGIAFIYLYLIWGKGYILTV